jgi:hypothetical protein
VVVALRSKLNDEESLLGEFKSRKDNQNIMMRWYNNLFQYLIKYANKFHLPLLLEAGGKLYRDIVFRELSGPIASSILTVIERRRQCLSVDVDVLKGCIKIFVDLNLYDDILETSVLRKAK